MTKPRSRSHYRLRRTKDGRHQLAVISPLAHPEMRAAIAETGVTVGQSIVLGYYVRLDDPPGVIAWWSLAAHNPAVRALLELPGVRDRIIDDLLMLVDEKKLDIPAEQS